MSRFAEVSPMDSVTRGREVVAVWAAKPDRTVLFDFNGTLSDDEPLLLTVYTEMFVAHLGWTLSPRHYYSRLAGRSDREIVGVILEELRGDHSKLESTLIEERRDRYRVLVERNSPIRPQTVELLTALRAQKVRIGIVTGAELDDVDYVLRQAGLDTYFEVIVTAKDVRVGKPDPEGFLLAAARLGINPAAALVFEDSLHGIRAARAAGMTCIAVEGTRPRAELEAEADAVIDRLHPSVLSMVARCGL
jgi:beta-phosphoglucomutase